LTIVKIESQVGKTSYGACVKSCDDVPAHR